MATISRTPRGAAAALRLTRAEYIRCAMERPNRRMDADLRTNRMREAAAKCGKADLAVNAEFAATEHDLED